MKPGPEYQYAHTNNGGPWETVYPGHAANMAPRNSGAMHQGQFPQNGATSDFRQPCVVPANQTAPLGSPQTSMTADLTNKNWQQFRNMQGSQHLHQQQFQGQQMGQQIGQQGTHYKNPCPTSAYPSQSYAGSTYSSSRLDNHQFQPTSSTASTYVYPQSHNIPRTTQSCAEVPRLQFPQVQSSSAMDFFNNKRMMENDGDVAGIPLKRQKSDVNTVPYAVELNGYQEGLHIQGSCFLTVTKDANSPFNKLQEGKPVSADQHKLDPRELKSCDRQNHMDVSVTPTDAQNNKSRIARKVIFHIVATAASFFPKFQQVYPGIFENEKVCLPDDLCQYLLCKVTDPRTKEVIRHYIANKRQICHTANGWRCRDCSSDLHRIHVEKMLSQHKALLAQQNSNHCSNKPALTKVITEPSFHQLVGQNKSPNEHEQTLLRSGQIEQFQKPSPYSIYSKDGSSVLKSNDIYTNSQMTSFGDHAALPSQYPSFRSGQCMQSSSMQSSVDSRGFGELPSPAQQRALSSQNFYPPNLQHKQSSSNSENFGLAPHDTPRLPSIHPASSSLPAHQTSPGYSLPSNCTNYGQSNSVHTPSNIQVQSPAEKFPMSSSPEISGEISSTFLSESEFKECPFGSKAATMLPNETTRNHEAAITIAQDHMKSQENREPKSRGRKPSKKSFVPPVPLANVYIPPIDYETTVQPGKQYVPSSFYNADNSFHRQQSGVPPANFSSKPTRAFAEHPVSITPPKDTPFMRQQAACIMKVPESISQKKSSQGSKDSGDPEFSWKALNELNLSLNGAVQSDAAVVSMNPGMAPSVQKEDFPVSKRLDKENENTSRALSKDSLLIKALHSGTSDDGGGAEHSESFHPQQESQDVVCLDSEGASSVSANTLSRLHEKLSSWDQSEPNALFADGTATFTTFVLEDGEEELEVTTAEFGTEEWQKLTNIKEF